MIALAALAALIAVAIGFRVREALGQPPREETARQLAAVLDDYVLALETQDVARFRSTIDPARPIFAKCQDDLFRAYARRGVTAANSLLPLRGIETYRDYVRAYAYRFDGWERVYFRHDSSGWKRTEPLISEIGSKQTRTYGTTTLEFWDIDADIADIVGHAIGEVRSFAVEQGGPPPRFDFAVRLTPVEDLGPGCGFAGQAQGGVIDYHTIISIRQPTFESGLEHLSRESVGTLEHEALHWIQREFSRDAMTAMPWWMIEGWPTARAQRPNASAVAAAFCDQPRLAWTDLVAGPRSTDGVTLVNRYYTVAAGMVQDLERIYGPDAYWKVVDAFRTDPHVTKAFSTIGATPDPFFADFSGRTKGGC